MDFIEKTQFFVFPAYFLKVPTQFQSKLIPCLRKEASQLQFCQLQVEFFFPIFHFPLFQAHSKLHTHIRDKVEWLY